MDNLKEQLLQLRLGEVLSLFRDILEQMKNDGRVDPSDSITPSYTSQMSDSNYLTNKINE